MTGIETPLRGGNMSSGVVRVGDTVRRPAGPWTPAVHALLDHLHSVGFRGAPRPLGLDRAGEKTPLCHPARSPTQRARYAARPHRPRWGRWTPTRAGGRFLRVRVQRLPRLRPPLDALDAHPR